MQSQQDEGVLKDVLDELDRERTRRAELELKVQLLEQENETYRQQTRQKESAGVSYASFMALQAEVESYREIINALTLGKPAIAAAAQAEHVQDATIRASSNVKSKSPRAKTLPLHIVRLLEVLPWEARAKKHIVVVEQLFEWQIYKDHKWQSHIKYFPTLFKTLRLVKPKAKTSEADQHNTEGNALLQILSGAELQKRNKQRILTDQAITVLYDTDDGFPLPTDGGVWEWIGSWRIVKDDDEIPCDTNGWAYVENPRDFANAMEKICSDAGISSNNSKIHQRPYRRRRWVRQRNLVDYPFASEFTQQYLRMMADNAKLQIVTAKINDQLIETKATLTEAEERLVKAKNEGLPYDASLPSDELMEEQEETKKFEEELVGGESSQTPRFERNPIDKLSVWVQQHHSARKASEDITLSDDSGTEDGLGTDSTHSDSTRSATNFDWKKLGRHQIMQKLKHGGSFRQRGQQMMTFRTTPLDTIAHDTEDDLML